MSDSRAFRFAVATALALSALTAAPALSAPNEALLTQDVDPQDPGSWGCSGEDLDLDTVKIEHAPVKPEEAESDGSEITPTSGPDGSWVPVVMVHGWTARSTHPTTDGTLDTLGAFSSNINLTTNRAGGGADVGRSLIGQLQGLPGAAVFTYDYHEYSGRWVTEEHIGPGLAQTINCLSEAAGNPAIVIGHSMGGLAAREALTDPDAANNTAAVITIGTPHNGSDLASWVADRKEDVDLFTGSVFTTLMSHCEPMTTSNIDTGGICGIFPAFLTAFDGEAGQALRTGSPELDALPLIPKSVPLYTLGGQTNIEMRTRYGWFGLPLDDDPVDLGDIIVPTTSAHPESASNEPYSNNCTYQLIPAGPTDGIATDLKLVTEQDKTNNLWTNAKGPCFHPNLPRDIQIANEITLISAELISETSRVNSTDSGRLAGETVDISSQSALKASYINATAYNREPEYLDVYSYIYGETRLVAGVYTESLTCRVWAFMLVDERNGTTIDTYSHITKPYAEDEGSCTDLAVVYDDVLITSNGLKEMAAIDIESGDILWSVDLEAERLYRPWSNMAVSKGEGVVIGFYHEKLIDPISGAIEVKDDYAFDDTNLDYWISPNTDLEGQLPSGCVGEMVRSVAVCSR